MKGRTSTVPGGGLIIGILSEVEQIWKRAIVLNLQIVLKHENIRYAVHRKTELVLKYCAYSRLTLYCLLLFKNHLQHFFANQKVAFFSTIVFFNIQSVPVVRKLMT